MAREKGSVRRALDFVRVKRNLLGLGLAAGIAIGGAHLAQGRSAIERQAHEKELARLSEAIGKFRKTGNLKDLPEEVRLPHGTYHVPVYWQEKDADAHFLVNHEAESGPGPILLREYASTQKYGLRNATPEKANEKLHEYLNGLHDEALDKLRHTRQDQKGALYDYGVGFAAGLAAAGAFGAARRKKGEQKA